MTKSIILKNFFLFCSQIRECLKLDPDDKQCQPHYKKVKKLVKQINAAQEAKVNGQYDECLNKAKQFMKTEPSEEFYQLKGEGYLCHCNAKVFNSLWLHRNFNMVWRGGGEGSLATVRKRGKRRGKSSQVPVHLRSTVDQC